MENIYHDSVSLVEGGARFSVDLRKRHLKVDGKYVIKAGQYEGDLGIGRPEDVIAKIEALYDRYNHSIPSERSDGHRKSWFRALPLDRLDEEDMLYGQPREAARAALEIYVLCAVILGYLTWESFPGCKWFWKSPAHPSLVFLREWIEDKETSTKTTTIK